MTTGPDFSPPHPPDGAGLPGPPGPQGFPPPGATGFPAQNGATAAGGPSGRGRSTPRKWLAAATTLVAIVVVGGRVFGLFGGGDPGVGDCVQMKGQTSFDVVDCASSKAQYKIVGIEKKKQTYGDFQTDDGICSGFPKAEAALWTGEQTGKGTVYCAASN
jgi:hypothetical protein